MEFLLPILIFVLSYMTFWFIVSLVIKRNDVADFAWGLGFVLAAWFSFFYFGPSLKALIINTLVTIWGLRLAFHIYKRNINKPEDFRYQNWRNTWKYFYIRSYLQIFILQGILMFAILVPVSFINKYVSNLLLLDLVGIIVWMFGFYFESTADKQLSDFLHKPKNKGKLMTEGLWKYSRHPNYFGEVVQWWGLYLATLSISNRYLTIIGPLTITFFILFVSGIPLLEQKYKGRPDFEEYKKHTSIFVPLLQKK